MDLNCDGSNPRAKHAGRGINVQNARGMFHIGNEEDESILCFVEQFENREEVLISVESCGNKALQIEAITKKIYVS